MSRHSVDEAHELRINVGIDGCKVWGYLVVMGLFRLPPLGVQLLDTDIDVVMANAIPKITKGMFTPRPTLDCRQAAGNAACQRRIVDQYPATPVAGGFEVPDRIVSDQVNHVGIRSIRDRQRSAAGIGRSKPGSRS